MSVKSPEPIIQAKVDLQARIKVRISERSVDEATGEPAK